MDPNPHPSPLQNTTKKSRKDLDKMVSEMIVHGVERVPLEKIFYGSNAVTKIKISKTCIRLEEWMSNAKLMADGAIRVIKRIDARDENAVIDGDLMAALKKYVQDAGESIKNIDNALLAKKSSLIELLPEFPDEANNKVSWRNLIRRRDVIAHKLLTVDDSRVFKEAKRDFVLLRQLLSCVYFMPTMTNHTYGWTLEGRAITMLPRVSNRDQFQAGEWLVFIREDANGQFKWLRMGRGPTNKQLWMVASEPGEIEISKKI